MTLVREKSWLELFAFGRLSWSLLTEIWDKFPLPFSQYWLRPAVGPHCEVATWHRWAKHFHFIGH